MARVARLRPEDEEHRAPARLLRRRQPRGGDGVGEPRRDRLVARPAGQQVIEETAFVRPQLRPLLEELVADLR